MPRHLTTSKGDALNRLNAVLGLAYAPPDLLSLTKKALTQIMGVELFESQWNRLSDAMQEWVARLLYFLPICPWGALGNSQARDEDQVTYPAFMAHSAA